MKLIVRRVLIGLVCGTVSSLFLCLAVRNVGLGLSLGALLGIAQIFAFFDLRGGSAIDRAECRSDPERRVCPSGQLLMYLALAHTFLRRPRPQSCRP